MLTVAQARALGWEMQIWTYDSPLVALDPAFVVRNVDAAMRAKDSSMRWHSSSTCWRSTASQRSNTLWRSARL